jgi:aryl-alcohol dehydrogenase-like predicted oxidoreductase
MTQGIPVVFGGSSIGRAYPDEASVLSLFKVLEKGGVKTIDSAQNYQGSEALLGKVNAAERFVIDTKAAGGNIPGALSRHTIVERGKESLKKLGVNQGKLVASRQRRWSTAEPEC